MDILEEQLKKFGLSEKEAKVYLALLEMGESTVNQISEKSGVVRSSTYVVLESLVKKELVKKTGSKTKQTYQAFSPDKLERVADDLLERQKAVKNIVSSILPNLKGVYSEQEFKPMVKVYEGKKGVADSFDDTLESEEKSIRVISSATRLSKLLPTYFPKYVKKRVEGGIKMIGIHPNDFMSRMLLKTCSPKFDDMVFIPKNIFSFNADVAIYDNKIAYTSTKGPGYAVVIECEEMANLTKEMFDVMRKKLIETDGSEHVLKN